MSRRYERWENNGWRPINDRLLVGEDPITAMTRLRRTFFPHLPSMRREDKIRRQKQRKRQWLLKIYRDGLASGKIPVSCHLTLCVASLVTDFGLITEIAGELVDHVDRFLRN